MGTLRLFDIKNYIEEYEIDTFVETGICKCSDGVNRWSKNNNLIDIFQFENRLKKGFPF